jgi:hypothetical protein
LNNDDNSQQFAMNFDSDNLYNYINHKYNLKINKSHFRVLLDKYKTDTRNREVYNSVFMTLFGLTLESLHTLALKYDFKKEYNDISETMKELKTTINSLTEKIELLVNENSELRDNYWRLNQSLLKATKK